MIISLDGQQHEFPDDASQEEISKALSGYTPPSTMQDIDKTIPAAAARGLSHGVGVIGDAANLLGKASDAAANYIAPKLGLDQVPERKNPVADFIGSKNIQSGIESLTGNPLYEPKTPGGKFVGAATEAVTNPVSYAVPGSTAFKAGGAAISGLGSEAAGQAAAGTPYETPARIAGGLATAPAMGLASKAITPSPATPQKLAANAVLKGETPPITATAGQQTGSKKLRIFEEELGGSAKADKAAEDFTTAALNRGDFNVPKGTLATPEVITKGVNQNSQGYKDWVSRNPVLIADKQTGADAQKVVQGYVDNTSEVTRIPSVEKRAKEIVDLSNSAQPLTSSKYQTMRSELGADASSADHQTAKALFGLQRVLDDTAERSIAVSNPADSGTLKKLNDQYRKLLVLKDAAKPTGEKAADGIISPARLDSAQDKIYGQDAMVIQGRGPFSDLARAGTSIMAPMANSNTAARHIAHTLGSGTPTLIGGFGAGALSHSMGGPDFSITGALAGMAAPRIAGAGLMSPPVQGYLANQLMTPFKPGMEAAKRSAIINSLMEGAR